MKKLNEILTISAGIFYYLKEDLPELYTKWFGETDTSILDNYMLYNYGERISSNWFEQNSSDIDAPLYMVFTMCKDSWTRRYNALNADYDVSKPYSYTENESSTTNGESTNNGENIESSKPYNSSDFVSSNKNTNDTNIATITTLTKEKTRSGSNGENVSERVREELELRKLHFADIVISDIINYISLSVYE